MANVGSTVLYLQANGSEPQGRLDLKQQVVVTLRGLGKVKVREAFRVLGYRDLIALVGPELQGVGIPRKMDYRAFHT